MPAGSGYPARENGDNNFRQGSLQESPGSWVYRLPSGTADGLAPGHTLIRIYGDRKTDGGN